MGHFDKGRGPGRVRDLSPGRDPVDRNAARSIENELQVHLLPSLTVGVAGAMLSERMRTAHG